MKICIPIFLVAMVCSVVSARSKVEFQGMGGLVRIAVIPSGEDFDSISIANDFDSALKGNPPDSAGISSEAGFAGALLDVYLLEISSGEELRFPVKYPQIRAYLAQHTDELRSSPPDDLVVAMIRELSVNLCVRMKPSETGGGK
ncbi:MAG: hypothetical protein JWO30_2717 [Fibrobacteres bacterium]|nr:hypothetical protein [Fibrobacterota bacterium]